MCSSFWSLTISSPTGNRLTPIVCHLVTVSWKKSRRRVLADHKLAGGRDGIAAPTTCRSSSTGCVGILSNVDGYGARTRSNIKAGTLRSISVRAYNLLFDRL